jgi:DNA polymerase delta subunit 2
MLLNAKITLSNSVIQLVPYGAQHVPRYHAWMQDPEVLELTASEPLSLEEEYAMQRTWQEDADKLTFIILRASESGSSGETERMVGDVNMFLAEDDEDEDENENGEPRAQQNIGKRYLGELEIMVAEASARRQGFGRSALLLFMVYILRHESEITSGGKLICFRVKVSKDNHKSLALFESLGFSSYKYVEVFEEHELRLPVQDSTIDGVMRLMRPEDHSWAEEIIADAR